MKTPTWKLLIGSNLTSIITCIILTTAIVSASFTTYNLYLDGFPHTATYTIETDGSGNYRAIKYDGSSNFESDTPLTTLQATVDALPNGGVIHIEPSFHAVGELVVNSSYLTVKTDLNLQANLEHLVTIDRILIEDTSTATTRDILIQGIRTQQIHFNPTNNDKGTVHVDVRDSVITPTTSYHGIMLNGTEDVHHIKLTDCMILDYDSSAGWGAINVMGTSWGDGQIYFERLGYGTRNDNVTFLMVHNGGISGPLMVFDKLSYFVRSSDTECKLIWYKATVNQTRLNVNWNDCFFELYSAETLITIDSATDQTHSFKCSIHHSDFSLKQPVTYTLMANSMGVNRWIDPANGDRNIGLKFIDNTLSFGNESAVFSHGTLGLNDRFTVEISRNLGFVTENSGTVTIANNENVTHGVDSVLNIGQANSTVLATPYTTVYDAEPVVVGCKSVNGTHIQISAYWTNSTAITDDAVIIWWRVEYSP